MSEIWRNEPPAAMSAALADIPAVDKGPWITEFGENAGDWNIHADEDEQDGEGSGLPGSRVIGDAMQHFAWCWSDFDCETAARMFNLPLGLVEAASGKIPLPRMESIHSHDFGELIATLTACRGVGGQSVALIARILNRHPTEIIEQVGAHYWMFLSGNRENLDELMIEMDGE